MKKIRLLTLLLIGLLVGGTAYAQGRVSGVVKSSEDGQPLVGVVVQIKGTSSAALTGADGSYTLSNATVGASTLVFTYAGMRTQSVAVAGRTAVNVTLQPDALLAEAVVVTAMGGRKQDRAIGYAVTTVKGEDLARTNTVSPANALQGKVAGVQISTGGSGGITTSPAVQIRGAKSLNKNNSPIYVIDGIVMTYEQHSGTSNNSGTQNGNQLKNLNPDDYDNITVLKGAAATSLYGSRGANGAIVITSKKGKARKGIGVEVNMTHEWGDTYASHTPLQNEYGMGWYKNGYEGGVNPDWNSTYSSFLSHSWGPSFESMEGQEIKQFYKYYKPNEEGGVNNPAEAYLAQPDNWAAFFQKSMYNSVSVALTGGSEKASFRLSYGYTDAEGSMSNNGFKRHSINFSTNGQLNDVFSTNFTLQYSNSHTLNTGAADMNAWGTVTGHLSGALLNRNTDLDWYIANRYDPVTNEKYGFEQNYGWSHVNTQISNMRNTNVDRNEQTLIAQLGLNAQFTDWLSAGVNISYNNHAVLTETKNYGDGLYREGGHYGVEGSTGGSYNGMAFISSNNTFIDDNLSLDVRVFSELYGDTRGNSFKKTVNGLNIPGVFSFGNTKYPMTANQVSGGYTPRQTMTLGVGAAAALGWKDQLFVEVTARNDWMSSLLYPTWLPEGKNNYSVFYPSINTSWIFSDTFNLDSDIISYGQLRASFAQVGMGTGYEVTSKGAGGFAIATLFGPQNTSILGSTPNRTEYPNYDLKPELQSSWEFGADVRFLSGRIGIDVAVYRTNTTNQILQLPAVSESGVSKRWINAGNIQNEGWEFELDFVPIRTRTVTWNIAGNISGNRGKIIELIPGMDEYQISGGAWVDATPSVWAFVGGEYGVLTGGGNYDSRGGASGEFAKYYNKDNANDPNNGKQLIYKTGFDNTRLTENGAPTNVYYDYVMSSQITGYYGENSAYWGGTEENPVENKYTNYGNVQPDFYYGMNTSLRVNLPKNSGSLDLFVQIDGRSGGYAVATTQRRSMGYGNSEESLYGRSAKHGGVERINWKGELESNGIIPDGVFWAGPEKEQYTVTSLKTGEEVDLTGKLFSVAVAEGHIQPVLASAWNSATAYGAGSRYISSQSHMALREVTIGYNFPEKWIKFVGLQSARLSFTGRNLTFLYNAARSGSNPDSFVSNNPLTPFDMGTTPFTRNFAFNLKLNF